MKKLRPTDPYKFFQFSANFLIPALYLCSYESATSSRQGLLDPFLPSASARLSYSVTVLGNCLFCGRIYTGPTLWVRPGLHWLAKRSTPFWEGICMLFVIGKSFLQFLAKIGGAGLQVSPLGEHRPLRTRRLMRS